VWSSTGGSVLAITMDFTDSITGNLRGLLQQIYIRVEVRKYIDQDDFDKKLTAKFGFEASYHHNMIESCRFLLEDTEMAIEEFEEFGLQGPTRHKTNQGEKYLRLYGFLSTIWLQKSVAIQLTELFKLPFKKEAQEAFRKLPLIQFRNIAGSHTLDYSDNLGKNHFRLVQHSIRGDGDRIEYLDRTGFKWIDLREELANYRKEFYSVLHRTLEAIIKKLFVPRSNNYKELNEVAELIKLQIEGNIVSMGPDGNYLVVMVEPGFEPEQPFGTEE
jgi:hypothetical protein